MNIVCNASIALNEWYATRNMNEFARHELRLPRSNNEENKAVLCVELAQYLSSFSIWGQGTTEWIIVDGATGETIVSEDSLFVDTAQLNLLMDRALEQLKALAK